MAAWRLIGIGATINDSGDIIAKFFSNLAQSLRAAAIFHRIMKKRTDRFGFIRAVSSAIAVTPRICA